jgi:hypothetical protein
MMLKIVLCSIGMVASAYAAASPDPAQTAASAGETALEIRQPTIAGNLPRILKARREPYVVTADVYVPSGKTVVIEPGAVMLFSNFTGLHVEGNLVANGTSDKPIVFSSAMDQEYNPRAPMHANPYDWDGIYIHEGGIGSTMANCKITYSVYGISSLTKYIRFDVVTFQNNGRSDLTIEGVKQTITSKPFSYALSVVDAKKDGVPVKILMDPMGKKRTILRYSGLGLLAAGCVTGIWCSVAASSDQKNLNGLKNTQIANINDNLYQNSASVYNKALQTRNRDQAWAITGFALALLGGAGIIVSFTF